MGSDMSSKITVFRNLNKAKKDPRKFVWSVAVPGLRKDGQPLRQKGKLREHTSSIVLDNPEAVRVEGTLKTIGAGGDRSVAAWIMGEECTDGFLPVGNKRLFTINPTTPDKGGRRELVFHYCSVVDGKLSIEEPVEWANVVAVQFTENGAYAFDGVVPEVGFVTFDNGAFSLTIGETR